MKKFVILALTGVIVTGMIANAVWAEEASALSHRLVVKDGENIVKRVTDFENNPNGNMVDFHVSVKNVNWEWYTPEEFEYAIMIAREPEKRVDFMRPPDCLYDNLFNSVQLGAERNRAILHQTLADIKKGVKVSKPVHIYITDDGHYPNTMSSNSFFARLNFVGWANWYVYGYTFTDKAGKEVDLGIYETRGGLFNALKFYCDKEVKAERMTREEADSLYGGIAHNVRNCDEMPLSDKLFNFRKLYNPYLYKPTD
ncbi:MAG: hypothetical protein FWG09_02340 [Synergistaceae bacterium]|nr:hypothetical protein [Synergistaceae bacterium]